MNDIDYNKIGIDENTKVISFIPFEDKDISFNIRGNTFNTKNKLVLVNYKKKFALKYFNEISDGMTMFRFLDRSEQCWENFDIDKLLKGISIIQNYDEDSDKTYTYLYNFSKHNLDEFNEMLTKFGVQSHRSAFKGKHIILDGERLLIYNEAKDGFNIDFDHKSVCSFLFGVSLVYGDYHFDGDILKSVKIHLPLLGNVAEIITIYDDFFVNIFEKLGIIIKHNYQKKYFGMNLQIVIDDWEILKSFKNFFKGIIDIESVSKFDIMKQYQDEIKTYIKQDNKIENKQDFIKKLESGVLKFLVK